MIEFREPGPADQDRLNTLWSRAFHEEASFLNAFFALAYSPGHCRVAVEDGQILAMLYWFDCEYRGRKLAYLYGVATDPDHQGRGLASALLADTHRHLEERGCAGTILVPGGPELFRFYQRLGYRTAGWISESVVRAGMPIPIREVASREYGRLRRQLLPENGVVQEGVNLDLLHCMARLYAGEDFIAAVSREPPHSCVELLGNSDAAPGLLAALDIPEAVVRRPGKARPFAMVHWFREESQPEALYFGLAFD